MENDSSGERNQQTLAETRSFNSNGERKIRLYDRPENGLKGGDREKADEEECDVEVWNALSNSFNKVQSVLDQNNILIQQVNENHQSKIPDNLTKNVALIREINTNIAKVVSLYSDLSVNFSSVVHQHQAMSKMSSKNGNNKDCEVPGRLVNEE